MGDAGAGVTTMGAPLWGGQGVKLMFSLSVKLLFDGASACSWSMGL